MYTRSCNMHSDLLKEEKLTSNEEIKVFKKQRDVFQMGVLLYELYVNRRLPAIRDPQNEFIETFSLKNVSGMSKDLKENGVSDDKTWMIRLALDDLLYRLFQAINNLMHFSR